MENNLYAPPKSEVADVAVFDVSQQPFFAVSLLKLAVLSLCTLGLYEVYWFYRQWRSIRLREHSGISPFWRAFFSVLYCYAFFKRIREAEVEHKLEPLLLAGPLAAGWIALTVSWKLLPNPYLLVAYLAVIFLLPAQLHANRVNSVVVPGHNPNSRFSAWNWVATVVGGLFLFLVVLGTFLPNPRHGV